MIDGGLAIALLSLEVSMGLGNKHADTSTQACISQQSHPPVPMTLTAEEQLEQLLHQRRQCPQQVEAIDAEIRDRFLQTRAILILDMAALTATTQEQGIIPALQEIYQLRDITVPLIAEHGGQILKVEADNVYGSFAHPAPATRAAQAMLRRLRQVGLEAGIGIGYGEVLAIGERDLYGDEMNIASRLGEDLAETNEILFTEAAFATLVESLEKFELRGFETLTYSTDDGPLTVHRLMGN